MLGKAPVRLLPRPLQDLAPPVEGDDVWRPIGRHPVVGLTPPEGPVPGGWAFLHLELDSPPSAGAARLIAVTGPGYADQVGFALPDGQTGAITMLLRLPDRVEALRLLPVEDDQPFRLANVSLRSTSKLGAGWTLGWPVLRRRLADPRRVLRTIATLARIGLSQGPRTALRHLASAILAGAGGPARSAAELAIDDATRYPRWIAQFEPPGTPRTPEPKTAAILTLLVTGPEPADAVGRTRDAIAAQGAGPWKVLFAGREESRAERLAALARAADTPFLAVLDPGDRLAPGALATVCRRLAEEPDLDVLYSDEDSIGPGGRRERPQFKPAWSPELLFAYNYFGRLTALRRQAVADLGGFDPAAGQAIEWDLHLKISAGSSRIERITAVLCHRETAGAADRPAPDSAAADARAVLARHWARQGIVAKVTTQSDGTQRSVWELTDPPLVSVIIPNKNKADLLAACVDGLRHGTAYPRIEIIIVDNLSDEPATLRLYRDLEQQDAARVVPFAETFNYSAACNAGARAAKGQLLLFLNNDIEVTDPDWLAELVRFTLRPGVGVAGTMLVFPDGALQHGGVVAGLHICGLVFRDATPDHWGVFGSALVPRTWLAIMGACQMIRRSVFDAVGGFDESFRISNSDVALCLAARQAGWRTVYTPFARLIHHEGATRGRENPREDLQRTVALLAEQGIVEDPYFHPGLSAGHGVPTLRIDNDLGMADYLRRETNRLLADFPRPSAIDLFDDQAVLIAWGAAEGPLLPMPGPASTATDPWSAAAFLLDRLRRDAALRQRFPTALSDGADGAFARWLAGQGADELGLTVAGRSAVAEAFAVRPAKRVRQILAIRDDLRQAFPLGATPAGRRELLRWLMTEGRRTHALRIEEIWWYALECAERPAAELVAAYLFQPAWQAQFPDGLTRYGRDRFAAWLVRFFRLEAEWANPATWPEVLTPAQQIRLALACRPSWRLAHPDACVTEPGAAALLDHLAATDQPQAIWCVGLDRAAVTADLLSGGVNLLGHFCYPSGLRTSAESLAEGLRRVGADVTLRDIWTDIAADDPDHAGFTGLEVHETTIIHTQPEPFFTASYPRAGLAERHPRTHRIGYWYWELDQIPASWEAQAAELDELWAATTFVADAMRDRFHLPVYQMMPGVSLPSVPQRSKSAFGLDDGKFTFLFVFHMMSIMERKNPLGLIRAYRQAFGDDPRTALVLKTSFGDKHPALMKEMREAAAGTGITIIDAVFSMEETYALMKAADCYVSLHRSEGFGLTMAEAMLLGKPVIATRYSGNVDFMDDDNSLLVDYRLATLEKDYPPYDAGAHWAEPSVEHAAALMRRVFESPDGARALGRRACADLQQRMSLEAAGRRMAARLKEIERQRRR